MGNLQKPKIEVTNAMIEAGVDVLKNWDSRFETDQQLVLAIYTACQKANFDVTHD